MRDAAVSPPSCAHLEEEHDEKRVLIVLDSYFSNLIDHFGMSRRQRECITKWLKYRQ